MNMTRAFWSFFAVLVLSGAVITFAGHAGEAAEAAAPPAPLTEPELIAVLESDADWAQKQEACRRLRHVGTQASIPALAALLPDETLSHLARFALESMPYPEVDQVFRDALGTTDGLCRTGVIISMGARRDANAVPLLIPLMKDAHVETARAAAGALGRIATPDAVDALVAYRADAPGATRGAVNEGVLAAAERCAAAGNANRAAEIYEGLLASDAPLEVRLGAFRGLAGARPANAQQLVLGALGGDDAMFRDLAAQLVAETDGTALTGAYAGALPGLPAGGQIALLRGLADRGDTAARPAVVELTKSADAQVQVAAIKALGALGRSGKDVATLVAFLAPAGDAVAEAAREALVSMRGDEVDSALASNIAKSTPPVHATLLTLLASRRAEHAIPSALDGLAAGEADVRTAALDALALLGGPAEAPAVIGVITKTADASERASAESALNAIVARKGEQILPAVLEAMNGAGPDVRVVLLQTAAEIGTPQALDAVLAAMQDANPDIAGEAVRMLSNWASLDAAPHLETLARGEDLTPYVLGLRGYVRLAREQAQGAQKMEMLTKALELARRPDEVKLVLGAWGTLPEPGALATLKPFLDQADVRNEAALAIIGVAGKVKKENADHKALALDALNAVLAKCEDAGIRDNAQKVLDGLQ
ncbi:MAG TPA: HEAT repeat domain-containing protein [Candidatus Hydrogenedentes bacterium]|jgi:HEAT repeat protein|nr:HEAT repeat domain-containing protein [FCB group bacterium]HNZ16722.1 HEAT repeat domain-containing protein [Candidatus Hydrogenedentota bacterium]HPA03461.1 HEAT repeat domain-containing protein [Candidatus Hydrogenedentota bacterium]HPV38767.1 HEAT repeat domain-containing protein [Candidatus Hydrogenedentota bacterium]